MKLGLCLVGGGAKGAFQGGVIKKLKEMEKYPEIITGTSIGAVNGYFLYKDAYYELERFWMEMDGEKYLGELGKTIDNSKIINELMSLEGKNENMEKFFVNYVSIEDRKLAERIVEINNLSEEDAINAVRYSSLLPFRSEDKGENKDLIRDFDSQKLFQFFKEDVSNGVYDGYNLDGGILNNNLLSPFIDNRVDKLIIVGLKDNYVPPEYIFNHYDKEEILIICPDIKVNPYDTVRFERDFCSDMYNRGYRLTGELMNFI
ncbi:hypothetical protein Q428_02850 [Fervidicella metallireducens AeB]|uniref:PNPLA domain-containing protein n=1 Tax=Fervidicella metallireducens AeB TaxID=1403537 RepID=A0A017RYC4_9CLOT|nr:patatin-like phospholipase family protein [Fervidicella metallireducens]EYE89414.1 hypothetical protein Q428_02850 [Fervidicella metallireducens AeB]